MSLINDALKQAKETQPKQTTADGPALRPSDPHPPRKSSAVIPVVITTMVLLAGFFLWEWFRGNGDNKKSVPAPAPVARPVSAVKPVPVVEPKPAAVVVKPTPPPVAATPTPTTTPAIPAPTLAPPAAVVIPPAPPVAYKLQSVFYSAKNPSAVINGEPVSVGSRLGDDQVIAIGKDSVTLRNKSGQTNLLELP